MKRLLSLSVAIVFALCAVAALAEAETEEPVQAELPFDGAWVEFDAGFGMMLPSDWLVREITQEQEAAGAFYCATNEDATQRLILSWADLSAYGAFTEETLGQQLVSEGYENVMLLPINGLNFVAYDDTANDVTALMLLADEGMSAYYFTFYPLSDDSFADTALAIAMSIALVE